jgi:hypothetical protein
MGENRNAYKTSVGKPKERDQLRDPGLDGSIILNTDRKEMVGS